MIAIDKVAKIKYKKPEEGSLQFYLKGGK